MNPDKLFDYLEGRLSPRERSDLEEQLMSDKQLQREFTVARRIHTGMRGDSHEVILPAQPEPSEQGRKMATRILVAFPGSDVRKRRHRSLFHILEPK